MKLVEDHWGYVEQVLLAHGEAEDVVCKIGFHYKSAMEHGYKHGIESAIIDNAQSASGQAVYRPAPREAPMKKRNNK